MLAKERVVMLLISQSKEHGVICYMRERMSASLLHVTYRVIHTSNDQESSILTERDPFHLGIIQLHYTCHLILYLNIDGNDFHF